jgi:hypothetical protein
MRLQKGGSGSRRRWAQAITARAAAAHGTQPFKTFWAIQGLIAKKIAQPS